MSAVSNTECPVCRDGVKNDPLVPVNCEFSHLYHEKCLRVWLNFRLQDSAKEASCLLCTRTITHINGNEIKRPQTIDPVAFDRYAKSGDLEAIEAIFEEHPIVNGYLLGLGLIAAAVGGQLGVFSAMLNKAGPDGIPPQYCCAALVAASRKNLRMVQILLASYEFDEESRGRAVCRAAANGQLEIIQALLSKGPISEEDRDTACCEAHISGHFEIVQFFTSNGHQASLFTRGVGMVCRPIYALWNDRFEFTGERIRTSVGVAALAIITQKIGFAGLCGLALGTVLLRATFRKMDRIIERHDH